MHLEKRKDDENEVLPPKESAAAWLCESLMSMYEESFTKVANKNGLHLVRKMSIVEAAAMWSEANISTKAARIILRHLRLAFGHCVQVPMQSLTSLTLDMKNIPTPTFGKYLYYCPDEKNNRTKKPEIVQWWMSDFCAIIAADVQRLIQVEMKKENKNYTFGYPSTELGNDKLAVDVVIGSDHGGGKSRILGKINLTNSQSRRDIGKIEHGARIHQFGNIDCKKDKAEILELIAPSLNKTLKKLEDGMLVGVKDGNKNVEVFYLPKYAKPSLTLSKNDNNVSMKWIEKDEEGCEKVKEFPLTSLKIQNKELYHIWTVVDNFVHFVTGDLAFLATIQGRDETSHCRCPWCDLSSSEWSKKKNTREGRPLTLARLDSYASKALKYSKDLCNARTRQEAARKAKSTIVIPPVAAPTNAPSTNTTINPINSSTTASLPSTTSSIPQSNAAAPTNAPFNAPSTNTATINNPINSSTTASLPPTASIPRSNATVPSKAPSTNTATINPTNSSTTAPPPSTTSSIPQSNAHLTIASTNSTNCPPPTPSRSIPTLPSKPDTKGVKSMPQWRIEPRRLIVPLLHLEIGLLNKAWASLNSYLDTYVENMSEKEKKLREKLHEKNEAMTELNESIELCTFQKQHALDNISSFRKQLAQVKKEQKSKKPAPPTKEQKIALLQRQKQLNESIDSEKKLVQDLRTKINEEKEDKRKLRAKVLSLKTDIEVQKKLRIGDEDGLDSLLEKILNKSAKIYPQAFHGGEMNGVCCLRFLNNVEEIMTKVSEQAHKRLKERKNDKMACTKAELTRVLSDYTNLFQVMDLSFSLL